MPIKAVNIPDPATVGETPYIKQCQSPVWGGSYCFQPGAWGYRARGTPDWLLIATRSGTGFLRSGKTIYALHAGSLLLHPSGERHDFGAGEDNWDTVWTHFVPKPGWEPLLIKWPVQINHVYIHKCDAGVFPLIIEELQKVAHWSMVNAPMAQNMAYNCLERALLQIQMGQSLQGASGYDFRISKALQIMESNLQGNLPVETIAKAVGLSPSRFAHLFQQTLGLSVKRYLEISRLNAALMWLSFTGGTVSEVAHQMGYATPFHFSRRFKARFGMNPSKVRKGLG